MIHCVAFWTRIDVAIELQKIEEYIQNDQFFSVKQIPIFDLISYLIYLIVTT